MNPTEICEVLVEELDYCQDTGEFRWKITRGKAKSGAIAGYIDDQERRKIRWRNKGYMAHRLAFLITTGRWPDGEIDHINGNQLDNRWCNLREASRSQNERNKTTKSNNTSGHKGVRMVGNRWRACIQCNGERKHIGYFPSFEEAKDAYVEEALRLHGEFANV